jgi:head-tail adaptor
MADKNSAGTLHYKIAFDKREDVDDGMGNTVSGWQEQFQTRAEFINLRGSEGRYGRSSSGQAHTGYPGSCFQQYKADNHRFPGS